MDTVLKPNRPSSPPSLRTRAAKRKFKHLSTLQTDKQLAKLVLKHAALHFGDQVFHTASQVCKAWNCAVSEIRHLVPSKAFGELKPGRRHQRFDRPHAVAFLPNGNLVIGDCDNFRLQVWNLNQGTFVDEINLEGGTACPTGVSYHSGHIFVVEHGSHQLIKLRHDLFTLVGRAGQWGGGEGDLRHPWGVCCAAGKVFVVDGGNGRVSVYGARGLDFCYSFGNLGRGKEELLDPKGCAIHQGEIYVADTGNNRIQIFSLEGIWSRSLGSEGSKPGQFLAPTGVSVANNRLYVTETVGARLQVLDLAGLPLQIVQIKVPLSGICTSPELACITALEPEQCALDANTSRKLPNAIHVLSVTSSSIQWMD